MSANRGFFGWPGPRASAVAAATNPRGFLDGFRFVNDATDAVNDINITAGTARASDNANDLTTSVTIVKQLDVAFAEYSAPGTASGMRSAAALADGTWHIFMVGGAGKNTQPFADTSLTPTLPGGFTFSLRVCSLLRVAGTILQVVQVGREFLRKASIVDADAANPGTSAVLRPVSVPTGFANWWIGSLGAYSGTNDFSNNVSSPDQNDESPHVRGTAVLVAPGASVSTGGTAGWQWSGRTVVRTNASAQIRTRQHISGASDRCGLVTLGWIDQGGANA